MSTLASGKTLQLSRKLSPGDATLYADRDIGVTAGRLFFQSDTQVEWIDFTGIALSGSEYTYSNLVRQLSQTADPAISLGTGYSWLAPQEAELVIMHDQLIDKSKPTQLLQDAKTYATTAARDAALGGDGAALFNYTDVKVTATGLFYNYNTTSGQWEVQGTGTATPNGSTSVSGSFQESVIAEVRAGTKTGGTGADLVITPDIAAQVAQEGGWIYAHSTTGTDTYTAAFTPTLTAYTVGQKLRVKFDTANTGACSLKADALATVNIKLIDGTDPLDGDIATGGTYDLIYDGTNLVLQSVAIRATDAEAITGTNTLKFITPKQAKDNYANNYLSNASIGTTTGSTVAVPATAVVAVASVGLVTTSGAGATVYNDITLTKVGKTVSNYYGHFASVVEMSGTATWSGSNITFTFTGANSQTGTVYFYSSF